MNKDPKPLEPADPKRCQAETIQYTPFALGSPHKHVRCDNQPSVIAREVTPDEHGRHGEMSLCSECLIKALTQLGDDFFTTSPIKATT